MTIEKTNKLSCIKNSLTDLIKGLEIRSQERAELLEETPEDQKDVFKHTEDDPDYQLLYAHLDFYRLAGTEKRVVYNLELANSIADHHFQYWLNNSPKRKVKKDEEDEYYLLALERQIIPKPSQIGKKATDFKLIDYLLKLEKLSKKKRSKIWMDSLKGFIVRLMKRFPKEQTFFIRKIFPEKMKRTKYGIVPKFSELAFPLTVLLAAKVIKQILHEIFYGRPDAQYSAAETLGLIWMCYAAARTGCSTHLKDVYESKVSSLGTISKEYKGILNDNSEGTYLVTTQIGSIPVYISSWLRNYLLILAEASPSRNNQILQSTLASLERRLCTLVKKIPDLAELERISFSAFLSDLHMYG